jgi:integrase
MSKWIMRWGTTIAETQSKPGVWRMKEGGYMIRARVTIPRTGRLKEVRTQLPEAESAEAAYLELQRRIEEVRAGDDLSMSIPSFGEYAKSLFARKIDKAEIKSAKSRERWETTLTEHLVPRFGAIFVDVLRKQDIEEWLAEMGRKVQTKKYSPTTINGWLSILRVIINTAVAEYELPRNPIALVKDLDTSTWHTYTEEQPNSLTPQEVPVFLAKLRELYPQHFALVALGFATGLRPSSLRPLRRCGDKADVLWDQGVLLVRRSQTGDAEPMDTTKTGKLQRISLPEDLIEILDWHVKQLPEGPMQESELLFPSETGGYRAASCLDRPFREITKTLAWKKQITPRAMRRTFQDLARAAEVRDIVTRSVSGHSTEAMQRHYSTVTSQEQRAGLAKVISLAKFREVAGLDGSASGSIEFVDLSGSATGSRTAETKTAGAA